MAFPTPSSRTLVAELNALPTVTLAPPPGLVPSRSLHVQLLAFISLIASCLIIGVTTAYVWKLWHREDKYYVKEDYSGEEYEDCEVTATDSSTMPGTLLDATVRERRPGTPDSFVAAREEARVAALRSGISRPFATRTMPLDIKDPAWTRMHIQEHGASSISVPVHVPDQPAFPPAMPPFPSAVGNAVLATDDAASSNATNTWERDGNGSLGTNTHPNDGHPPQIYAQGDHYGGPLGFRSNNRLGQSARTFTSKAESEGLSAMDSGVHRQSGIDWKDDGSSLQGSDFTKSGISELGRSSYANRYEDY